MKATLGSVRVDLMGGTLDLPPINRIIPNVVTLNLATELKARCLLSWKENSPRQIEIYSHDFQQNLTLTSDEWLGVERVEEERVRYGGLTLVVGLLRIFKEELCRSSDGRSLRIELSSLAPAGSGLGGSSAMAVTLVKGLAQFFNRDLGPPQAIVDRCMAVEGRLINCGPIGYQDYYPALYGGILALRPGDQGVEVEQLHSEAIAQKIEQHCLLLYSGQARFSGTPNWEIYKGFFDDSRTRDGFYHLAQESWKGYQALKSGQIQTFVQAIMREGQLREEYFSVSSTEKIQALIKELQGDRSGGPWGYKMCGAGGGGCFLVLSESPLTEASRTMVAKLGQKFGMNVLPLKIGSPI